ncbi:GAF domain-containing protein [Thalassotalea ponticola]|uniref:GAF domain-containing protein n=1 Tax=Thalassotalea ponticola TaxID=1523392 RepID=UPI0025B4D54D|nr:GAF domain-containing protein [Thalassotalea ponticola]MDN3652740.1 GAF domain-containing protein [Thalassotalea ponticola]
MEKTEFYRSLLAQVDAIIGSETDVIANMANVSAILFNSLENVNWAGFYRMVDGQLVLGPFQGQVACIRIDVGRGVCGTAVSTGQVQCIIDVHQFPGHIACDAASNSEIVIPVYHRGDVIAVLDIDSTEYGNFDEHDVNGLQAIVERLQQSFN